VSKTRTYARNLLANWLGYGVNLAVVFFLSPFIIHRLGDATYGVWSVLSTVTGYLGLIEMGVRVSTGRYVNYYLGRNDRQSVNRIISSSLAFYAFISILALTVAGLIGLFFGRIFPKFPPELIAQAPHVLLLLACNVLFMFFASVFAQLLHANERFDLRNACDVIVVVFRAAFTVWVLLRGGRLVALAVVQVASGALACVLMSVAARWKGPDIKFSPRYIGLDTIRELFGFGVWAFTANVSFRIVYYSATIIIGILLGAEQITFYTIAFMLVDYGRNIVAVLPQQILKPATEKAAGRQAFSELRWYLLRGSRMVMFFAVPLLVGFIILGREFFQLWLADEKYARSGAVLAVLAVSQFAGAPSETARAVLQAVGRVKHTAFVILCEAVLNVCLTVLLVWRFKVGIIGAALGTTVPMLLMEGLVLPVLACRSVGFSLWDYALRISGRWALAGAALLALMLPLRFVDSQLTWPGFAVKTIIVLAVYAPIGWFLLLDEQDRTRLAWLVGRRRSGSAYEGDRED